MKELNNDSVLCCIRISCPLTAWGSKAPVIQHKQGETFSSEGCTFTFPWLQSEGRGVCARKRFFHFLLVRNYKEVGGEEISSAVFCL